MNDADITLEPFRGILADPAAVAAVFPPPVAPVSMAFEELVVDGENEEFVAGVLESQVAK